MSLIHDLELERAKIGKEKVLLDHKLKVEREEQRHKNILEELTFMKKNKVTSFTRHLDIEITKKEREVKK